MTRDAAQASFKLLRLKSFPEAAEAVVGQAKHHLWICLPEPRLHRQQACTQKPAGAPQNVSLCWRGNWQNIEHFSFIKLSEALQGHAEIACLLIHSGKGNEISTAVNE